VARLTDEEITKLARRAAAHTEAGVEEASIYAPALETICWELLLLRRRSLKEDITEVFEAVKAEAVPEEIPAEKTMVGVGPTVSPCQTIPGIRRAIVEAALRPPIEIEKIEPIKPGREDSSYSFKRGEVL
jgi:hypothetical protein